MDARMRHQARFACPRTHRIAIALVGLMAGVSSATARGPQSVLATQIALERAGFSPGLLDGREGAKTHNAIREFQRVHGLSQSGEMDDATRAALRIDEEDAIMRYTITVVDVRSVGPNPRGWAEKAKLKRLGHASLSEALAERGHTSRAMLARLNPGRNLDQAQAGEVVNLPNVPRVFYGKPAAILRIELDRKQVRAMNAGGATLAIFPCSIAAKYEKRPRGETRVKKVAFDPTYRFDPKMWTEVHGISKPLTIPAGPRNPVGLCWIGLGLPGYGIHGTPNPELIGKTGSHGCIRLANWDAVRLGHMVKPGVRVVFAGK